MKVSFIIPLYNCLPLTQAMLASLRETLPAGLAHEIIFVDDGSTDGTRDWLAGLSQPAVSLSNPPSSPAPCRVILNEQNLGFAKSCNRGAAAATGEFLFFLNNDLVLLPGWLEPMLAAFARAATTGITGNVQRNFATGALDHTGIYFNHQGKPAHLTSRGLAAYRHADAVTGACFAIRRTVWTQLGGFDEGFVNGCEDVDLCLRARDAGFASVVALRSVVRHHISASTGRKLRDEQNTWRLLERWQDRIIILAARDWSRRFIELHWDQSFVYDDVLARQALACWLGLLPGVPAVIRDGVRAALAVEFERWRRLAAG